MIWRRVRRHERRFDIPFARDGSVRFLPWIVALMVYLAGLALAGTLLLHSALADWNRGLAGVMTVELPPATNPHDGDAEMKLVLALLRATSGRYLRQGIAARGCGEARRAVARRRRHRRRNWRCRA